MNKIFIVQFGIIHHKSIKYGKTVKCLGNLVIIISIITALWICHKGYATIIDLCDLRNLRWDSYWTRSQKHS